MDNAPWSKAISRGRAVDVRGDLGPDDARHHAHLARHGDVEPVRRLAEADGEGGLRRLVVREQVSGGLTEPMHLESRTGRGGRHGRRAPLEQLAEHTVKGEPVFGETVGRRLPGARRLVTTQDPV